ncbi:DUF4384 domain-containing protein [Candidatus Desantisbacteria bacterium]|nr:DUF4384 domain-containing protein [Candidatus Desantisbacteria bacterium]
MLIFQNKFRLIIILSFILGGCTCKQLKKEIQNPIDMMEYAEWMKLRPSLHLVEPVNKIFDLHNPNPEFEVKIWTNKPNYAIGEFINFYFKASRNCYVTLIHCTTSGEVYVLFPNQYSRNNFIQADKIYKIPGDNYDFKMKSVAPYGTELIKAIASIDPVSLFDMNFDKTFYAIDTGDINIAKKIETLSGKFNQVTWADIIYKFQIYTNEKQNEGKGLKEEEGKFIPKPIRSGGSIELSDTTSQNKKK